MVAVPSSWGRKFFPAICIHFRTATRSSQIALSPAVQASALATLVTAAAALAYLGISQIRYIRLVGDEESTVARMERANIDLQDSVANLGDRLAASARDRAVVEDRLSALANEANTLRGQLELTEMKLVAIEQNTSDRKTPPPEQAAEAARVEPAPSQSARSGA